MKDRQFELFDSCNDCKLLEPLVSDFRNVIHVHENNVESERILKANLPHISKQCQKVLEVLKSGEVLTVRSAMIFHGISSLPRRILDLKRAGFEIKDRLIDGRYKEYFL